jgi:hypothetical protein
MAVDKYALTVGINRYSDPNARLSGCVNDARDWAALLRWKGYEVVTLVDEDATRTNVLEALREQTARLGYRDRFVFQYSGHGSWIPDRYGDEFDGRDEVIVTQDMQFVSDDDLFPIFSSRKYGSRVTVLSDSCHSGSVNRFFNLETEQYDPTPRFLSPVYLGQVDAEESWNVERRRFLGGNAGILVSGCKDDEYSYDAWFGENNRPNGAFTRAAINAFDEGLTYPQWRARIDLPNNQFDQSPQLSGTAYQLRMWEALD